MEKLKVVLTTPDAKMPIRTSCGAAGYDLFSAIDVIIPPKGKAKISTDIKMKIPEGYYGRIAPRSGLAWKKHVAIGGGVIDPDFRGIIHILIFNHAESLLKINKGDRIAQIIITKAIWPTMEQVDQLDETPRGEGGFGSSGLN